MTPCKVITCALPGGSAVNFTIKVDLETAHSSGPGTYLFPTYSSREPWLHIQLTSVQMLNDTWAYVWRRTTPVTGNAFLGLHSLYASYKGNSCLRLWWESFRMAEIAQSVVPQIRYCYETQRDFH